MPPASTSAQPKTLTDKAYIQLRHDIIHGHYAPNTKLRVEHLRKHYEVGATPIREALSRLTADGFVTLEEQRGFRVAGISQEDLEDLTNMRVKMEEMALTESIQNGDDEWEVGIVAAYHRLTKAETGGDPDIQEWEIRNRDFHLALIAASSSKWLRRFYTTLYDQHKRYRNLARLTPSNRNVHEEHEALFNAAMERDVKKAVKANEIHIRNTAEVIAETLEEFNEVQAKNM